MTELSAWAVPTPDPISIPPKPQPKPEGRRPFHPLDLLPPANLALMVYVGAYLDRPLYQGTMLVGALGYVLAEAYARTNHLTFKV